VTRPVADTRPGAMPEQPGRGGRDATGRAPVLRSAVPGIAWPGLPGDSGIIMLALLAQLEDSQWWPRAAIEARQRTQLSEVLRHAAAATEYYRDILTARIREAPEPDSDEWLALPTLDRITTRDRFDALRSDTVPEAHGPVNVAVTSGSTGKPVQVAQTALSTAFEGAALLRYHKWHGRDFQARLASIKHNHLPVREGEDYYQDNWGWPVSHVYHSGRVAALTLSFTTSEQAEWLLRIRPEHLLTLPSNLKALLEHFRENRLASPGIRSVSTMMEVVSPALRALCREVWGAPIIDSYSCRETGTLAVQCPRHEHYHVVAENTLVEILRDDGSPCAPGETGRVIITDLHNLAMPLIRYELGDYAEVGPPCDCGRGLPVINRIHGRLRNMMRLPGGDRVWPSMARTTLMHLGYIRQYQFVQVAEDTIEANLVVTRPLDPSEERQLVSLWHQRWPYPFKVVFRYPRRIDPGSSAKIEDFRCAIEE